MHKNPLEYNGDSITFGNGGGISGMENSKIILNNGKVFEIGNMGSSYTFLRKISQEEVNQLFLSIDILKLKDIELHSPGNTYKFIEINHRNTKNRIVWSANNASDELQILYRILTNKAQ